MHNVHWTVDILWIISKQTWLNGHCSICNLKFLINDKWCCLSNLIYGCFLFLWILVLFFRKSHLNAKCGNCVQLWSFVAKLHRVRACLWVCIWPWTRFHRIKVHNREPWPLTIPIETSMCTHLNAYYHWKVFCIPFPYEGNTRIHRHFQSFHFHLLFALSIDPCHCAKLPFFPGNISMQSVVCACARGA